MLIEKIENTEAHNEIEFHTFAHLPDDCLVVIDNTAQIERRVFSCASVSEEISLWKTGAKWF